MYVRWQKRNYTKNWQKGTVHWSAILVETVRVNGKPTQRHIAYLGGFVVSSIRNDYKDINWSDNRYRFWRTVNSKLKEQNSYRKGAWTVKLTKKDRQQIIAALAKRVPMPG